MAFTFGKQSVVIQNNLDFKQQVPKCFPLLEKEELTTVEEQDEWIQVLPSDKQKRPSHYEFAHARPMTQSEISQARNEGLGIPSGDKTDEVSPVIQELFFYRINISDFNDESSMCKAIPESQLLFESMLICSLDDNESKFDNLNNLQHLLLQYWTSYLTIFPRCVLEIKASTCKEIMDYRTYMKNLDTTHEKKTPLIPIGDVHHTESMFYLYPQISTVFGTVFKKQIFDETDLKKGLEESGTSDKDSDSDSEEKENEKKKRQESQRNPEQSRHEPQSKPNPNRRMERESETKDDQEINFLKLKMEREEREKLAREEKERQEAEERREKEERQRLAEEQRKKREAEVRERLAEEARKKREEEERERINREQEEQLAAMQRQIELEKQKREREEQESKKEKKKQDEITNFIEQLRRDIDDEKPKNMQNLKQEIEKYTQEQHLTKEHGKLIYEAITNRTPDEKNLYDKYEKEEYEGYEVNLRALSIIPNKFDSLSTTEKLNYPLKFKKFILQEPFNTARAQAAFKLPQENESINNGIKNSSQQRQQAIKRSKDAITQQTPKQHDTSVITSFKTHISNMLKRVLLEQDWRLSHTKKEIAPLIYPQTFEYNPMPDELSHDLAVFCLDHSITHEVFTDKQKPVAEFGKEEIRKIAIALMTILCDDFWTRVYTNKKNRPFMTCNGWKNDTRLAYYNKHVSNYFLYGDAWTTKSITKILTSYNKYLEGICYFDVQLSDQPFETDEAMIHCGICFNGAFHNEDQVMTENERNNRAFDKAQEEIKKECERLNMPYIKPPRPDQIKPSKLDPSTMSGTMCTMNCNCFKKQFYHPTCLIDLYLNRSLYGDFYRERTDKLKCPFCRFVFRDKMYPYDYGMTKTFDIEGEHTLRDLQFPPTTYIQVVMEQPEHTSSRIGLQVDEDADETDIEMNNQSPDESTPPHRSPESGLDPNNLFSPEGSSPESISDLTVDSKIETHALDNTLPSTVVSQIVNTVSNNAVSTGTEVDVSALEDELIFPHM